MRLFELFVKESYYNDLIIAVQDLLVRVMNKGIKEIATDRFKSLLAKQGYVTTDDELISALNDSGFVSSVDSEKIVPKGELPADMNTDAEQTVDVGNMAGNQAMQDIKADL
jgi:hypothetical protein